MLKTFRPMTMFLDTVTNVDLGQQLTQLGLGALLAVPAYLLFVRERKDRIAAETRERTAYESLLPTLRDSTETLKNVKDGMEAKSQSEVSNSLSRLERMVDRLAEDRLHGK